MLSGGTGSGEPSPTANGPQAAFDDAYYASRYRYAPSSMYWWSVRYYARLMFRHLPSPAGLSPTRVLEVGCGVGHMLQRLGRFCSVWGIDISTAALMQARAVEPTARLLQARAEALPIGDATFDAVLARHVLEHVPRPESAIAELHRVLRPGGVLIAAMPNPTSLTRSLKGDRWVGFRDPTHVSLWTPTQWLRAFTAASFQVERYWGDGLWDVPYLPLLPVPLQLLLFALPAAVQVLTVGSFVPTRAGESVIFVLRAPAKNDEPPASGR